MILVLQDCEDVEALYETDKSWAGIVQAFFAENPQTLYIYEGSMYSSIQTYAFDGARRVNPSEIDWERNAIPEYCRRDFRKFVHETCTLESFHYM